MYENAIKALQKIDPISTAWLRVMQPFPDNDDANENNCPNKASFEIDSFVWMDTPQGQHYWHEIYMKVGGENRGIRE